MQDLTAINSDIPSSDTKDHLIRPRINAILAQSIKNTLTVVWAGMGCGKTRAVHDFTQECKIPSSWIQLSESENTPARFWSALVHAVARINMPFSKELKKMGFPDTADKVNIFFDIRDNMQSDKKRIYVIDDLHLIKDPMILAFIESFVHNSMENCIFIVISRELPQINISGLMLRNKVNIIGEDELNFTESELNQYLLAQGLSAETNNLSKIYQDTNGWAFIVNFVVRILKKSPGYLGYAQGAIKQDISLLLEQEVWTQISDRLKNLLLRLSLTNHRSAELVNILAGGDEDLISELKEQKAFIRFDRRLIDSYSIHQMLVKFLLTKQDLLSDEEKRETNRTIANWCLKNDFIVDAFFHYEKIGDYESIVSVMFTSPVDFIKNTAQFIETIFINAPAEVFDHVDYSAAMHIHVVMCLGKRQEAFELLRRYEAKYLAMPEDDVFRNRMLGCIYYYWGILRMLLCTVDDCYDFDGYFAKLGIYLRNVIIKPGCWYQHPPSLWTNLAGSSKAGAPEQFLSALIKSAQYIRYVENHEQIGLGEGLIDLCRGELLFYGDNVREADLCIGAALENAMDHKQFEIYYRALFYAVRIAVYSGDYDKIEALLAEKHKLPEYTSFPANYLIGDIVTGWYYNAIDRPAMIPDWLKEKFSYHINYINSIENFGNHIKAKYCYLTKNYVPLLSYIEKKKSQPMILYERVELLALEACVHSKMDNDCVAICILNSAWETAAPNNIVMPFIELGKDMRNLINEVEDNPECRIPQTWLKNMKQRIIAYTRNLNLIEFNYKKANGITDDIMLSPREKEILADLHDGLSRLEIADKYGLSINTVKLHINGIYNKTGARNRADIFRVVTEQNLL